MNSNSVSGKNWKFKKYNSTDISTYKENFLLSEIAAKLLSIRKNNIQDVALFLNPKVKNLLPNPLTLKDMKKGIERTYSSIINNEPMGIFGDYDVDGATSTALLARYFLSINQKIQTYIPDRQTEGYGPSNLGFTKLIESGSKIIFTVDCGTLSYDPIKFANKSKVDVIVLDHHQSEVKIPEACAVINPNRYDDTSGLNYLCAAGVCFVFLVALNSKLRDTGWFVKNNIKQPNVLNFLDLVSLGTVCDVVPLVGLNRALVKQGLKVIKKRSNLGLKTLYDLCKIESQPTTFDLGFKLGPRINAGGRVGKSSYGAELLISNDPKKAYEIALDLDKSNQERQSIELLLSELVDKEVANFHNHPVLVLCGKNWHEGVIGIVASRIKDKYGKPAIIISLNKNIGKGSARSVVGFDIGQKIIKSVQLGIVKNGGGHKMAGGFTIDQKNIPKFRNFLITEFEKNIKDTEEDQVLYLDSMIAPSAINETFLEEINVLSPFGSGNNEPKFAIENIKVISSKIIGKKHIKSVLCGKDGFVFNSYAWNSIDGPLEPFLCKKKNQLINLAGKIKLNEWRGEKKAEFVIDDISLN